MLVNEEAIYDNKNTEPVYIILMHSGTLLSNIIKNVQGDEFSHSLISFNSKLDPMYSFGNKKDSAIGLNGDPGFVVQNTKDPFYKSKKSYYEVYVMFVSKNDKQKMIQRMKWFKEKDRYLGYDIIGLLKYKLGISSDSNLKKYFCSRFVAEIIGQSGRIDRDASLYSPQDFKDDFSFISLVNKGDDLYKYDYKLTEENLKKVKKGDYSYEKGTRFGHYLESTLNEDYKRIKGVEFDAEKNLPDDIKNNIKSGNTKIPPTTFKKYSTTSPGKDIVDSEMQTRIENFDKEMHKLILESEDVVKEYNKWVDFRVENIINTVKSGNNSNRDLNGTIENTICDICISLHEECNMSYQDLQKYIKNTYFYQTENPNNIKLLCKLRIKYCEKMISTLSKMIKNNGTALGITKRYVNYYIEDLNSGNSEYIKSTMWEIKRNIINHIDVFQVDPPNIDLKKIGLGKIFVSDNTKDLVSEYQKTLIKKMEDDDTAPNNRFSAIDQALQKATKYDAIILAHGGVQKVIEKDKDGNKTKEYERWSNQGIRIDGKYYYNMNDAVKALVDNGYKKILIFSCNPGHFRIPQEIIKGKGIIINYSDNSNFVEGTDYEFNDEIDTIISESEYYIKELEYMDGCISDIEPLSESFLDKLKEYVSKAVKFIISLFKRLWSYIIRMFNYVKSLFKGEKGSGGKLKEPVSVNFILTEMATTKKYNINTVDQLETASIHAIQSLQKEIANMQKVQIDATKKLESYTDKLSVSPNNESSLLELSFMNKPGKYVNDDYDREKGIELDFKKNAGKDKELKYITYYSFAGEDKWSTTSIGKDIVDSQMQQRLETFDQAMAKQILEAEDIVKAYNDWIEGQLDYIQSGVEKVKYTNKRTKQKYFQTEPVMDDPSGAIFAARYVQSLANDLGVSKDKVREFIKGTFFYTTDDPEEIRKLLEARLLYSQQTVQILTEVVDKNAEILGLTDKTAKSLIKKMNNDKTMNKGIAEIKKAIIKNRSKFLTNDGECIDLTSIGGGKIFFTGPAYKTLLTPYLRELERTDPDIDDAYSALDMYFQKAMVYDCIVFAHGADFNNLQYLITSKLNKWALDKMDPDRRQYYSDLDTSNKTMDKNNKSGLIKKRWMMEPIRSDKSDYFNDMNSFVKQLLKEGHRKILIATCNPGNYALSPEVRDMAKRVKAKIIYSDYSTLIESYNYDDNDLRSIAESVGIDYDVVLDGENELRKLSESFDIDYDNLNEIVNINESDIIRNIKDYSKKILASIISIFKTGWNNIKNFIRFSGSKLSNSKEEIYTVKVGLIFPDERNIGVFTISSPIELRKWATKSCDSIEYELKTLQSTQLQSIKDIMNFKDYNNESTLLSESLNEFLMNGMTIDEALSVNEAKLDSKERKALSDDEFGLPEKRKFPLNDKKHVLLAIKFFNRCDKKDQEELAKNIFKAMKKYDIPMDAIGKNNKLRNYMKESVNEGLFSKYKTINKEIEPSISRKDSIAKAYQICDKILNQSKYGSIKRFVKKYNNKYELNEYINTKSTDSIMLYEYDVPDSPEGAKYLFGPNFKHYDEVYDYVGEDLISEFINDCDEEIGKISNINGVSSYNIYTIDGEIFNGDISLVYKPQFEKIKIDKKTGEVIKESTIEEMYPGNPIVGLNTEKEMIVDNMMNNAFTSLEIDEDIIEKCLRATTEALMNKMDNFYVPYIPYIQEYCNMDMNIGFYKDLNGIFVMNESTGLRSPSYKEVDDIDDRTILYITNGELNDSKLNDL